MTSAAARSGFFVQPLPSTSSCIHELDVLGSDHRGPRVDRGQLVRREPATEHVIQQRELLDEERVRLLRVLQASARE